MVPTSSAALSVDAAHAAARRILGCDHLADDAVQEALVALWRQPTAPAEPQRWLVRAVIHRARHLRRTLLRRTRHEHEAAHRCPLHTDCDNPLHHARAHELASRLADAVAALPEPQRVVFELHEHAGLDYAGLARHLRWPLGTVRSRLHRARDTVTRTLRPAVAPEPEPR